MKSDGKNPWFSLVTPEGPAGVAVWMLGGCDASSRIQNIFVPVANPAGMFPINQSLGVLRNGRDISDEVLLVGPQGSEVNGAIFEIHGHGGSQLAAMHRLFFAKAGFDEKSSGELSLFPGRTRLASHLQQLAIRATTSRACRALLHQSRVLPESIAKLIQLCLKQDDSAALAFLTEMESGWGFARRWLDPFRVSVLGPPNAGKSSLLNFLAGKKRAVVSPVPGTTVDLVRVSLALEGWPIELCDTAGVRDTADEVEQQGIDLAFHSAGASDLVLWLRDGTGIDSQEPPSWLGGRILEVWTKKDLVEESNSKSQRPQGIMGIPISTRTGEGCEDLQSAILTCLLGKNRGVKSSPMICSEALAKTASEVRGMLTEGAFQGAAKRLSWWLESVWKVN